MRLVELIDEEYQGGLRKWFKQKWVNIGKKKKGGGHPECGTSGKKSGYAKCVPASKAASMSKKEKESATRRKRAAQNKAGREVKEHPASQSEPPPQPASPTHWFLSAGAPPNDPHCSAIMPHCKSPPESSWPGEGEKEETRKQVARRNLNSFFSE